MKRRLPSFRTAMCIAGIMIAFHVSAQKAKGNYVAEFEDGTKVNYALYQNHPEDLFRKYVTILPSANEIGYTTEFSFSTIVPGKFQWKAGLYAGLVSGFGGVLAGGTWYFGSGYKGIDQKVTVKSENMGSVTKKYVVKVPCEKGKFWGVNAEFGFNRTDYGGNSFDVVTVNDVVYGINKASYGVIAIGLGYNSLKGAQVKVKESEGGYIGGTRLFTAVADLVLNPGMKLDAFIDTTGQNVATDLDASEAFPGSIGFRIYAQAQTTFLYHKKTKEPSGALGIVWRVGINKSRYTHYLLRYAFGEDAPVSPVLGLGIFYTFY